MRPLDSELNERAATARHRTLIILWFSFLFSIGLFFFMTMLIGHPPHTSGEIGTISFVLMGMGAALALVSTLVKGKLLESAFATHSPEKLTGAYVITFALVETAGIFGLLDFFLTGQRYYYVVFIIAAAVMLLHIPKREHVISALYENRI